MKRLILAVLVAAFVDVTTADADYYGHLQAALGYTINVSPETNHGCAVTAIFVTKTGRMDVDYILTVTDTARGASQSHTIPNNVVRLVIEADYGDPPYACVVEIEQGGKNVGQVQFQHEGRLVFDVI